MSLRIIQGSKGSGKTVLATRLAYLEYKKGRSIFANYQLAFDYEPIDADTFNTPEGRAKLKDCVLVVDEAHNYFGARSFMSEGNRAAGLLQRQIRKRRCDLILTSQQALAIDIDFRRNLEILDECFPYHEENGEFRKCSLWEIEHQKVDMIMVKEILYWAETSSVPAPVKWMMFKPKPYYGLYDSDEFIDF